MLAKDKIEPKRNVKALESLNDRSIELIYCKKPIVLLRYVQAQRNKDSIIFENTQYLDASI